MNLINLLESVSCTIDNFTLEATVAGIIKTVYTIIQFGVPVILIIVGSVDLGKAITQQKEDEIKKAQNLLIKKVIAAGIVLLMFSLTTSIMSFFQSDDVDKANAADFVNCILKGKKQGDRGTCVGKQSEANGVVQFAADTTTNYNKCKSGFVPMVPDPSSSNCICQKEE